MANGYTRMLIGADLHCGHRAGITPPAWQWKEDPDYEPRIRWARLQRLCWEYWSQQVSLWQPIDIAIWNGDLTEGKGTRSGASELITADRAEQADMAAHIIRQAGAKRNLLTYGTPYHTGLDEDWEGEVAKQVDAPIEDSLLFEINGLIFDVRHFVPRSSIPHGAFTPLARERLWETLRAEAEERPSANVIIRSHAHYFIYCGQAGRLMVITPAGQAKSKFGGRVGMGMVDVGLMLFEVRSLEDWKWSHKTLKPGLLRRPLLKL